MSIFFLTKIEDKVFRILPADFVSVTSIAMLAKVPRTSAFKALVKLEELQLVQSKKIRLKNQHLFKRQTIEEINTIFESIRESLLHDGGYTKDVLVNDHSENSIYFFKGKQNIILTLDKMLTLEKGERIYTVQASGVLEDWIKYLGEKEVVLVHKKLVDKGLILVSVQGDKLLKEYKYAEEIKESFKGRLNLVHTISDEFLERNTALYVYRSTILFINIEKLEGTQIENKQFASALKKIITFISQKIERSRSPFE